MGVDIYSHGSDYSFSGGYGAFYVLRKNIAETMDPDFGLVYGDVIHCHSKKAFKENDRATEWIINKKHLDDKYEKVIDFLYMSDCGGEIPPETCKQIYDIIKDIDFSGYHIRYEAHAHNDYEEFKAFLKDCFESGESMVWS